MISERVGVHGSKARVILSLLRRAGALVERDDRIGAARWRTAPWDDRAVRHMLTRSDTHRDGKSADLAGIVGYAQTGACRRRAILDHFGDDAETGVPPAQCCDACRVGTRLRDAPADIPAWDALPMNARIALGLLDAVRKMRWPVGRLTLAKILAGSEAKGMERYLAHPYYGRLSTLGQTEIDRLYKQLLLQSYLRIGGGEYPVIELTPLGEQALDHRETIEIEGADGLPARRAPARAADSAEPLGDADDALFERLRAWRTAQATERGVPSYLVFNDRTLRALATVRPATETALLSVNGIGPGKASLYGRELLDLIAESP
jgi:ATP-dependent DNA helicase RecQ